MIALGVGVLGIIGIASALSLGSLNNRGWLWQRVSLTMLRSRMDNRGQDSRSGAVLLASILCALGCGTKEKPPDAGFVGSVAGEADAGSSAEPSMHTIGSGTSGCRNAEAGPEPALEVIPEYVLVVDRYPAVCDRLGSGILLRNRESGSLRVLGVSVSPSEFSVEAEVPVALAQDESIGIRVFYASNEVGAKEGTLTVATTAGCRRFVLHGLAAAGGVLRRSDEAIDFGAVAVGNVSAVRLLSIVTDNDQTETPVIYSGFQTSNPLFEIVSAPAGQIQSRGCEPIELLLRFRATSDAGMVEANLGWSTTVETPDDGTYDGVTLLPLYGRSIGAAR